VKKTLLSHQRGATLIVGLVMLVLLTIMVSSAFTLSTINTKAVGNQQVREEAVAAADAALELVLSESAFYKTSARPPEVIDFGGKTYTVNIAAPECTSYRQAASTAASSVSLPILSSTTWDTNWELVATVADIASGAGITVRSGVRVRLDDAAKNTLCS
jgi:Tfp pilus assembly protein PilX